jgi:hypothetical protein
MSLELFMNSMMKDNCKSIETDNIKKIYNKDFDLLVYKMGKKTNSIIIDKRNSKTIIYNNIDIAIHHLLK